MVEGLSKQTRITYNEQHDVYDVRWGPMYIFSTHNREQAEFAIDWIFELVERDQLYMPIGPGANYHEAMQAHSAKLLLLALHECNGNQKQAAAKLDMPRSSFISRAQRDGALPNTQDGCEPTRDNGGVKEGGV